MKFAKKIYYIANARMPTEKAHGIQLAKMCEAFIEAGVDLELVVPKRKTDARSIKEFYGLRVDILLKRLGIIPVYQFDRFGFFIGSLSFAVRYFFYLGWKRWICGEKFIIYTTDLDQFSFFLIPLLGVPYFVEMHDAKKKSWPFSILFWRVSGVISINKIIRAELNNTFHIPGEKNIIEPNAVDHLLFNKQESREVARKALGLAPDQKIAMYVGKVYAWKGLVQLVEAAKLMPDVLVYLVGGTAEELRSIGVMDNQPKNFICVGQKSFTEIPRWLWAADILIVLGTEKDDYSRSYTSPMKIFEYAAARRPILASSTPAIGQILSKEEAFFCAPDSVQSIVLGVNEIFDDISRNPDHVQDKINKAYERLGSSWKKRAIRILDFMAQHI